MKYSITVSAVESWKIVQKQLKSILLKDLSPIKIKTVVTNFVLNHINNSFDAAQDIFYISLLVYKPLEE